MRFSTSAFGAAPFAVDVGEEVSQGWGRCVGLRLVRARILEVSLREAAQVGGPPGVGMAAERRGEL